MSGDFFCRTRRASEFEHPGGQGGKLDSYGVILKNRNLSSIMPSRCFRYHLTLLAGIRASELTRSIYGLVVELYNDRVLPDALLQAAIDDRS